VVVLAVSLAALSLLGIYLFSQPRLAGDVASHLLLAVSPILKIGSPYKDFWEIKPPVWPIMLYFWSRLFGFSILSIRIINVIVAALVALVTWHVYKRIFRFPVLELIYCFSIVIVLSPILNSIIFPTELLALLLSLSALLSLIGFRNDFPKFYLSGLLFFAASQTKEPFTFTILSVVPVFIVLLIQRGLRATFKNAALFLLGVLTSFIGIYIYLARLGSVGSYVEVFKFKQAYFPFSLERFSQYFYPGFYRAAITFTEYPRSLFILIAFALISFYLVNRFKKTLGLDKNNLVLSMKSVVIADSAKIQKYSALFYAIGSFVGFALGATFGSHYLIQVVVPFYVITGLIYSYLFNSTLFLIRKSKLYFCLMLFMVIFSTVMLMPKRPYLSSYIHEEVNFILTDNVYGFERRITELTAKDQCVLSVYGWGTSESYLYSERRPCTRFFLANIVLLDWQKREYAKEIIENIPAVITYQIVGADMDVEKFESEAINVSKIVKNCYKQDSKEKILYVPKINDVEILRDCIKTNAK
jgi:hypothetical protein